MYEFQFKAVIVNEDAIGVLPLRVIVPLTDLRERYTIAAWMVQINPDLGNGLIKPSVADAFQIRSVSIARFVSRSGFISEEDLNRIHQAVKVVVGL